MKKETEHDFEISELGLGTCRKCGCHMTRPQFPPTCNPKPEPKNECCGGCRVPFEGICGYNTCPCHRTCREEKCKCEVPKDSAFLFCEHDIKPNPSKEEGTITIPAAGCGFWEQCSGCKNCQAAPSKESWREELRNTAYVRPGSMEMAQEYADKAIELVENLLSRTREEGNKEGCRQTPCIYCWERGEDNERDRILAEIDKIRGRTKNDEADFALLELKKFITQENKHEK